MRGPRRQSPVKTRDQTKEKRHAREPLHLRDHRQDLRRELCQPLVPTRLGGVQGNQLSLSRMREAGARFADPESLGRYVASQRACT